MSPRTGRPLSENPKSEGFHIRVTPQEKQEILKVCKERGITILELIRLGIKEVEKK